MIISAITENETVGSWLVEVNELNLSFFFQYWYKCKGDSVENTENC